MARAEPRPGGGPPRPWTDRFMWGLPRLVLGVLYRDIERALPERFPAAGPVIVIANHGNSILDGAMLLAVLPRTPRFLAASTVWDHKPVAPFMDLVGSVKVYRRQDGRAHEGTLADSFAQAGALLAAGGVLAVFPEGRTHDTPALLPFKTGTARIAQLAAGRHGAQGLAIVPLGIDFEAKTAFRSRVLVTFGSPIAVAPAGSGPAAEPGDQTGSARALTAELERALRTVAPDFTDAAEARLMWLAGEVWAAPGPGETAASGPGAVAAQGKGPLPLSLVVAARRRVQAGLAAKDTPETARDAARRALGRYGRLLRAAGLTEADLGAGPPSASSFAALLLGSPLALLGVVLNGVPALAIVAVSRRHVRERQMTWAAFGGLTFYPVIWALWGLAVGLAAGAAFGPGWGWAAGLATPPVALLLGLIALRLGDHAQRIGRRIRVQRLLRRRAWLGARLGGLRQAARAALGHVVGGPGW